MANALSNKPQRNMLAQAALDPSYWSSVRQGLADAMNRGVIGGIVGAPVDIANTALGAFGLGSQRPVMGSEWIGQQMQSAGLVSGNRNALAEGLASFIDPATMGAGAAKLAGFVPAFVGMAKGAGSASDALRGLEMTRGRYSWEIRDQAGNVVKEYPSSFGKKEVAQKYADDLALAAEKKASKKITAKENAIKNAAIKQDAAVLSDLMSKNSDLIANFHKQSELNFTPVSDDVFNQKQAQFIYQSPSYGNKPGSAYKLVMVDGRPAYARQSDHWGNFSARSSEDFDKWNDYNWILPGAERGKRQTGVVFLDDLIKK